MAIIVEEKFDIVDEFDHTLGYSKTRKVVHSELSDWHRVTAVYIVNYRKEILCQKRSMTKDVEPGIWQCFFGGHVKSGQSYSEAAVAELAEEVGIYVEADELMYLGSHKSPHSKHHCANFVYSWNGTADTLLFHDGEVERVQWYKPTAFAEMKRQEQPNFAINPLFLGYYQSLSHCS